MLLIAFFLFLGLQRGPLVLLKCFPVCSGAVGVLWWPFPEGFQFSWGIKPREAGLVCGDQCLLGLWSPDLELGHRILEVVHGSQHEVQDMVLLAHQGLQPWFLCGLFPAAYIPLQDEEEEHKGTAHHGQAQGHLASAEESHPPEPMGTPAESAPVLGPALEIA